MKKIMMLSALALVTAVGCATDPTDENTDDTTQAVTNSFTSSCFNNRVSRNSQPVQAITDAWSFDGCIKKNGTLGPRNRHYSGLCFTDVSNCDGELVCQNHCP